MVSHRALRILPFRSLPQGTYLGTLEGVNHLDLVGWINTARYKWAEIMGREIKFKPATFYLGIADHLARVVEGQAAQGERDAEGRPSNVRESSGERRGRERAEMADSLGKGESQAGTPVQRPSASGGGGGGGEGAGAQHRPEPTPGPRRRQDADAPETAPRS